MNQKTTNRQLAIGEVDTIHSPKPWLKSYLNDNNIDWSGQLPITRTGLIDQQKAKDMGLHHGASGLRAIPVIARDSEQYQELCESLNCAEESIKPASSAEAGFALKRLSVWCPMPSRNKMDFKMMLHDALADLANYPLDLIQKACSIYRNDPDRRNDFFPRPGRLKELVQDELYQRKTELYRLTRLREQADNPPKLPIAPSLSDFLRSARRQLDTARLITKLLPKKKQDKHKTSEREEIAIRAENRITQSFMCGHLTKAEMDKMKQELHAKFSDIFNEQAGKS